MSKSQNKASEKKSANEEKCECEHEHEHKHAHKHKSQSGEESMEAKQRDMQKKYYEMQIIDAQIKQVQKQLMTLDSQTEEIKDVIGYLTELGSAEVGKELFVPLTSGVFVKAELKDNKKVLMNVGSNVVVAKSIDDGKGIINRQLKEVEKVREQLMKEFQKLVTRAQLLEKELMELVS